MSDKKIYAIDFREVTFHKGGLSTCACISCIVCRRILSGNGGGGTHICENCLELLYRHKLKPEKEIK